METIELEEEKEIESSVNEKYTSEQPPLNCTSSSCVTQENRSSSSTESRRGTATGGLGEEFVESCDAEDSVDKEETRQEDQRKNLIQNAVPMDRNSALDEDDDDNIEPLAGSVGPSAKPLEPLMRTKSSSTAGDLTNIRRNEEESRSENTDNVWMQVGGSLAVLGAVAGGVALALHHSNGADDRSRRRSSNNASAIRRRDEADGGNWDDL